MAVTGVVTLKTAGEDTGEETWFLLDMEGEDGALFSLRTNNGTCFPFSGPGDIGIGDRVTGYYRAGAPMPLMFPPRYSADVLVAGDPGPHTVKVDMFRSAGPFAEFISGDGALVIRIGPETKVMGTDGERFVGILHGRSLAVLYDIATRSMPPQTVPFSVTVLPNGPAGQ
jgi:hypothetical protein